MNKLPTMFLACLLLASCSSLSSKLSTAFEDKQHFEESAYLNDIRQLTFVGKRNGEGYYSRDGGELVFQGEREADNPFYQIYTLKLPEAGLRNSRPFTRISSGVGKTTCPWFSPNAKKIIYSSTSHDQNWTSKKKAELERRQNPGPRDYAWDYDEEYEIYVFDRASKSEKRLTNERGYDAEASISPDGTKILFASNRNAYLNNSIETSDKSPEHFIDLFVMDRNGDNVQQLTNEDGYDGGPFFSPDGKKIVWRRFNSEGTSAEIWTMNSDGSNKKQITTLNKISWAPFFHPSGDYIIFSSNLLGFKNFELFIVDTAGLRKPVRVSFTDGFDGLPVFSPDGNFLTWTSQRSSNKTSQLFTARWNHQNALQAIAGRTGPLKTSDTVISEQLDSISIENLKTHVESLASKSMLGRMTGTEGEKLATEYVAEKLKAMGFLPAGDINEDGGSRSYFQSFEFSSGMKLGAENSLKLITSSKDVKNLKLGDDWLPTALSKGGRIRSSEIVFASYGIVAPEFTRENGEVVGNYDSYAHADVKDKWVMVLRYIPRELDAELKSRFSRYASLRYKAMVARDRGARGILFVSGEALKKSKGSDLISLSLDSSLASSGVAAISLSNTAADRILSSAGKDLESIERSLSGGAQLQAFPIPNTQLQAQIDIIQEKKLGRNVVAKLEGRDKKKREPLIIGAHIDHLGRGHSSSSRASGEEKHKIHLGADDNASGVAAILEIARVIAETEDLDSKRDLYIGLWSGEELGLIGSSHFVKKFEGEKTKKAIAYLNLDMVGRLKKKLILQGLGSSSQWMNILERANLSSKLLLALQSDTYLPTDATSFYLAEIPILSGFTGVHSDYHKPSDTPEKIQYAGLKKVSLFFLSVAEQLMTSEKDIDYLQHEKPTNLVSTGSLKLYLGTIPDYGNSDVKGVLLSGVTKGAPADQAGLKAGDRIIELGGKEIANIYDYTFAIGSLELGKPANLKVVRDSNTIELTITPSTRN